MGLKFRTKASTLEALEGRVTGARILPQVRFTTQEWRTQQDIVLDRLNAQTWFREEVIVRSSALSEDAGDTSLAGHFQSVAHCRGHAQVSAAVEEVLRGYPPNSESDEVFVQPMLQDVACCGVAFSRDPNSGAPYMVISFDESGATDSVTSGNTSELRTVYLTRPGSESGALRPVVVLVGELEGLFGPGALDVEFAIDHSGQLYLLQVRPLHCPPCDVTDAEHRAALANIADKIERESQPHPYLCGERTVYGVMPDWNPAEIIGVRPRPLALSLYRDLVTDSVWAYQRDNYGYKNLRSFPLLQSFHGLPYIDVRVSFNSFLPADLDGPLAEALVGDYIERLQDAPTLHDKVEFEIIYSCYSFDLWERFDRLRERGFEESDLHALAGSLRRLTNRMIHGENGLWRRDIEKIGELESRIPVIESSNLDPVSRIYWLLEDCKRYGTLPFAGLARSGFVAVQMLRSLVAVGLLSDADYGAFLGSLDTISSQMSRDFRALPRQAFLARYGHLRPGTYDLLSPRYDETPERYFDWSQGTPNAPDAKPTFALTLDQMRTITDKLEEHGIEHTVVTLFEFIKAAIEGREYAKFVFTRSLSDALREFRALGDSCGFDADDCSYMDIQCIRRLYGSSEPPGPVLAQSADEGRRRYALTRSLTLPPLITEAADVWSFERRPQEPNYITSGCVTGPIVRVDDDAVEPGSILLIPSADPGFDWIFSREIAGFITAYGGVNSHMAIRAAELGIPAVIGAGEALFERISRAKSVTLDAANQRMECEVLS